MYKHHNNPWLRFRPFYAADGGASGGTDGSGENNGEDIENQQESGDGDQEQTEEPEKKEYTQQEIDNMIEKRLQRERRKWQKESSRKPEEQKAKPEETEKDDKTSRLEAKVACYEAGVAKEAVDDVTDLARAYMQRDETLDMEDAIEKVLKKYPQFKNERETSSEGSGKAWGERQGRGQKKEKTCSDEIAEALYGKV